jgi:GNAT superfamily N-acetyltransferase
MNIEYTIAAENDIDLILDMMSEFYKHEQIKYNKEILRPVIIDMIQNPSLGKIWLINADSEVIGYFTLTFIFSMEYGGRNALLDEIFIKDSFRRKGIGKQTLKFIEQQCKLNDIHAIHLQVNNFNPSAKNLYEFFGFEVVDRIFMKKEF